MFCLKEKMIEMFNSTLPGMATDHLENISVECLPYCNACLEYRNSPKDYATILVNQDIHPIVRFLYVLLNGIQDIIDYRQAKTKEILLMDNRDVPIESTNELYNLAEEISSESVKLYHSFYDEIEKYYPNVFHMPFDHELIHNEIQSYGFEEMISSDEFKFQHLLHYIHLILLHGEVEKALRVACSLYLKFVKFDYHSFAKSSHSAFGQTVLVIGSALDEGATEYHAILGTKEFLAHVGIDDSLLEFDSKNYVIERRMYKMLIDKLNLEDEEELLKGLFGSSSTFISHPCLYPRILKYSDELNLIEYKKAINELQNLQSAN